MDERVEELERRLADAEARLARMDVLERRLAALEERVTAAEQPADASVIAAEARAPFRIVDQRGKPLLQVDQGRLGPRLRLFSAVGEPVAVLYTAETAGALQLYRGPRRTIRLSGGGRGGEIVRYDSEGKEVREAREEQKAPQPQQQWEPAAPAAGPAPEPRAPEPPPAAPEPDFSGEDVV